MSYYNAYQHHGYGGYQPNNSMMPPQHHQQHHHQQQPQHQQYEDEEDHGQNVADESDVIPTHLRQLRACLTCGLVKTTDQFKQNGCENCPKDSDTLSNTTTSFEGLITLMSPQKSWVARYQNLQDKVEGVYAITVHGQQN